MSKEDLTKLTEKELLILILEELRSINEYGINVYSGEDGLGVYIKND